MRIVEVELHQILVSDVELGCGPMVVVWVFLRFRFLKWTMVEMWISSRFLCLRWTPCSFVDIIWDPAEFVSEMDLVGVVVRTFSC